MAFINLEETDMVLIFGEVRGRQIYDERILHKARTFVNVVQRFRDFGRFLNE
jgi:hypothetical protein